MATHSEWELMRQHAVWGARMLQRIPGLEAVAQIVRAEHEHWDGTGYPDGLSGTDIPIASRIILACDAYHAMTSDRPYRRAITLTAAARTLQANAATQFDPSVIDALLSVLADDTDELRALHTAAI